MVADEVRKLAEESQAAAGEIAEIIGSIQQEAQKAVVSMGRGFTLENKFGQRLPDGTAAGASFDNNKK